MRQSAILLAMLFCIAFFYGATIEAQKFDAGWPAVKRVSSKVFIFHR